MKYLRNVTSKSEFVQPSNPDDPVVFAAGNDAKIFGNLKKTCLNFTAKNGEVGVKLNNIGGNAPVIYYSFDCETWTLWDYSEINIEENQTLYMYGENANGISKVYNGDGDDQRSYFTIAGGDCYAAGNIMSLISKDCPTTIPCNFCFAGLFEGCKTLITAPELPSLNLKNNCYYMMFRECTSLSIAPELPANTLASSCYFSMFAGCTSLVTAPSLWATTLAEDCYGQMFLGCTSLTTVPVLYAKVLTSGCYWSMLGNCGKVNYIKCYATDISANFCIEDWLSEVAETGDIYCIPGVDYENSDGPIPSGWHRHPIEKC